MVYTPPYEQRGTSIDPRSKPAPKTTPDQTNTPTKNTAVDAEAIIACKQKGGTWDYTTRTCILPVDQSIKELAQGNLKIDTSKIPTPPEPSKGAYDPQRGGFVAADGRFYPTSNPDFVPGQADKTISTGSNGNVTITGADGKPITLTPEEYKTYLSGVGNQTNNLLAAQAAPGVSEFQNQQLAGQVGQFGELPTQNNPLFDQEQAFRQGIVGAIPRALSLAATGAGIGLFGGGAAGSVIPGAGTAAGAGAGAAIGAVGGFVSGISNSMISQYRGQRTDTINAQKRVLDEGKQTMKDWATLAEADPANKAFYLARYNEVSSQIDQAYRQMKLDTNRDVAKFETALPDLAEFEAFYAAGGEKDTLDADMRNALLTPASPEYKMLELAQRRNQNQNI